MNGICYIAFSKNKKQKIKRKTESEILKTHVSITDMKNIFHYFHCFMKSNTHTCHTSTIPWDGLTETSKNHIFIGNMSFLSPLKFLYFPLLTVALLTHICPCRSFPVFVVKAFRNMVRYFCHAVKEQLSILPTLFFLDRLSFNSLIKMHHRIL